jgi:putative transposase
VVCPSVFPTHPPEGNQFRLDYFCLNGHLGKLRKAASVFRTIFAQPTATSSRQRGDQVRDQLSHWFPKIAVLMDDATTEVLAFTGCPRAHCVKVWSRNPLERLNK